MSVFSSSEMSASDFGGSIETGFVGSWATSNFGLIFDRRTASDASSSTGTEAGDSSGRSRLATSLGAEGSGSTGSGLFSKDGNSGSIPDARGESSLVSAEMSFLDLAGFNSNEPPEMEKYNGPLNTKMFELSLKVVAALSCLGSEECGSGLGKGKKPVGKRVVGRASG